MKRRGFIGLLATTAIGLFGLRAKAAERPFNGDGETHNFGGEKLAYQLDYANVLPWGPGAMVACCYRCATPEKAKRLREYIKSLAVMDDVRPEWDEVK